MNYYFAVVLPPLPMMPFIRLTCQLFDSLFYCFDRLQRIQVDRKQHDFSSLLHLNHLDFLLQSSRNSTFIGGKKPFILLLLQENFLLDFDYHWSCSNVILSISISIHLLLQILRGLWLHSLPSFPKPKHLSN